MLIGIYLYSEFPLRIYRCFLATEHVGNDTFRIRDAANSTERETFCGETEARIDDARINYRRERPATRKR